MGPEPIVINGSSYTLYNLYKWPYKWVTRVINPLSGVVKLLIIGRGPSCKKQIVFYEWNPPRRFIKCCKAGSTSKSSRYVLSDWLFQQKMINNMIIYTSVVSFFACLSYIYHMLMLISQF